MRTHRYPNKINYSYLNVSNLQCIQQSSGSSFCMILLHILFFHKKEGQSIPAIKKSHQSIHTQERIHIDLYISHLPHLGSGRVLKHFDISIRACNDKPTTVRKTLHTGYAIILRKQPNFDTIIFYSCQICYLHKSINSSGDHIIFVTIARFNIGYQDIGCGNNIILNLKIVINIVLQTCTSR